ncbi:MAG: diguanylate cyclase [Treponema sp.]|nr:diguanylate cyclase [Treponema sp.]
MNYLVDKKEKTVLIVDDQETTITVLSKILGTEYTVYTAVNGPSGIKAAEKFVPDVILLDILMLDMDGYEVLSVLKKSPRTKDIPVIFITSLDSENDEAKGLANGAADYITKPFSPAIVKLRLHNQIKMLDQMRMIEKLSMIDQLTELPNRRNFENRINSEWARAARDNTPLSIMVIDIDFFKDYNDKCGHLQGDVALQRVSQVFINTLKRPGDFAVRWGGEEFIIILPSTDISGAIDIAEQIRRNIEKMVIPCQDENCSKITVSVGVNTREKGMGGTIHEFIQKADKALYEAKAKGRNRVFSFSDET